LNTQSNRRRRSCHAGVVSLVAGIAAMAATGPAQAFDCPNGALVPDQKFCDLFVEYVKRGDRPVDSRIASRFPTPGANDPEIRSFAFVVSISEYPQLVDPSARVLSAIRADLPKIIGFLREQQFDEILVLQDKAADADSIRSVFDDYLIPQAQQYSGRARFLFAYDGHGAKPLAATLPGGIALSTSLGDGDTNSSHVFPLADLRNRLEVVATLAYQSVALLGSCFSGGVFPVNSTQGENFSYSLKPGAHVVTAARADELAWTLSDNSGTVFFEKFISSVRNIRPTFTDFSSTVLAKPGGVSTVNNYIVRLARAVDDVNENLEGLSNPVTHQPYPQLLIGAMAPNKNFEGAFFFLGTEPQSPTVSVTAAAAPVTDRRVLSESTGSSVRNNPQISVFDVPEAYKIRGIDLSSLDGPVDFEALRQNDIRFAYIRSSQGSTRSANGSTQRTGGRKDPKFEHNWGAGRKAGLAVGAYHVFSFCETAANQFETIKAAVPLQADALPLAIDLEWYGSPGIPGEESCNSIGTIKQNLRDLADRIKSYYGKTPMIYASATYLNQIVDKTFSDIPVWVASWLKGGRARKPNGVGENPWTVWQFTADARLEGVSRPVELNAFFGSEAQFKEFMAGQTNVALAATRLPPSTAK
jgi:GH25 family lysozyme M1 (1,4-beta-N-acetylmuramidase)